MNAPSIYHKAKDLVLLNLKSVIKIIIGALYVFQIAFIGDILRNEKSPWIWDAKTNHGTFDLIIWWLIYIVFYSIGYAIPYYTMIGTVESILSNRKLVGVSKNMIIAVRLFSLASLTTFIIMLNPIIAFLKSLPEVEWIILWVILFFIFLYLGTKRLLNEISDIVKRKH